MKSAAGCNFLNIKSCCYFSAEFAQSGLDIMKTIHMQNQENTFKELIELLSVGLYEATQDS